MTVRAIPAASEKATGKLSLLAKVTILSLVIPINFTVSSLYFTTSRMLFIVTVPYLLIRWIRGDLGKILYTDMMVLFYVAWMLLTIAIHHPSQMITFVGSNALVVLGGYLTARATIRSAEEFLAFGRFLTGVVVLMLPFALYEAITTEMPIGNFIADFLPNVGTYKDNDYCCRLGLDRAQVVFVHAIHFGLFASMPFAIFVFGMANRYSASTRLFVGLLIGGTCFLSVSSGAVLALAFQFALVLYGMVTRNIEWNWKALLIVLAIGYAIVELASNRFGLYAISERLAFNSATAYGRKLIFDVGTDQIARTPIFGFGLRLLPLPRYMTGSVDNFWLLLAVTHGVPAFLACFSAFIYSMIYCGRSGFERGSDLYNIRVAWTVTLVGLTLSLSTVALWAELQTMTFLMLGAGQFLFFADPSRTPVTVAPEPDPAQGSRTPYSRFPVAAGTRMAAGVRPMGRQVGAVRRRIN